MNTGYVKVHRALLHHWLWENPKELRAWLYLLFEAEWTDKTIPYGDETITLKRGQLSTTIRTLQGAWGYYSQATLNLLEKFEKFGMIVRNSTRIMTIITIVNYDLYQLDAPESEHKSKRKSKHSKEDKNERNKEKINSTLPTVEQEIEFFNKLIIDEISIEQVAMLFHSTKEDVIALANKFKLEMEFQRKFHNSYNDYRQHFLNWARINFQKGAGGKRKVTDGKQGSQDKYQARRGTDAGNHTEDDYSESFTV